MVKLVPPTNLSINKSSEGILLSWSLPQSQSPPIDSFVVQSRLEGGEWINLKENISPVESQIFLPGLCKVNVLEDMIWDFHESVSLSFLINATLSSLAFIHILSFFSHCITLCRTASTNWGFFLNVEISWACPVHQSVSPPSVSASHIPCSNHLPVIFPSEIVRIYYSKSYTYKKIYKPFNIPNH